MTGVTTAILMIWPYSWYWSRKRDVEKTDAPRFTKRLPIRIVISMFWGSDMARLMARSLRLFDPAKRWRSDFFRAKRAVSDPEKKADRRVKIKRIKNSR